MPNLPIFRNRYDSLEKYLSEHRIVSPTETANQFTSQGSKYVKHEGVLWVEEEILRRAELESGIYNWPMTTVTLQKARSLGITSLLYAYRQGTSYPWFFTADWPKIMPWSVKPDLGPPPPPPPPRWPQVTTAQLEAAPLRVARQKVPDTVSTLTAYRAWKVVNKHALAPVGNQGFWPMKEQFQAVCNYTSDSKYHFGCPCIDCNCGIWGFRSVDSLMDAIDEYDFSRDAICLGVVDLWGHYVEHEFGWRAEFAYPRELWFFDESLEPVAANYGVPFRVISLAMVHQPKGGSYVQSKTHGEAEAS